jgi:hypothetical protein
MKTRKVDTITSSEEMIRLSIYDGDIPLDEAGAALIQSLRNENRTLLQERNEARREIDRLNGDKHL